jgi:hypothetical protein
MQISRAARSHGDQEDKLEEGAPALQASLQLSDADIEKRIAEFASAGNKRSVVRQNSRTSERRNQVCRLTIATVEP